MSFAAMRWAWDQAVQPSQKLVLMALANRADDAGACWPSIARITAETGLSERTVQYSLKRLVEAGLVTVGGGTGRGHPSRYTLAMAGEDETEKGAVIAPIPAAPSPGASEKGAMIAPFSGDRTTDDPEKGATAAPFREKGAMAAPFNDGKGAMAAPFSDGKGAMAAPFSDGKGAIAAPFDPERVQPLRERVQNFPERVQNLQIKGATIAPEPIKVPIKEPIREPNTRARGAGFEVPAWMPVEAWNAFVEMRRKMPRRPFTGRAGNFIIGQLARYRDAGHDVEQILMTSVANGWSGVFAPRDSARQPARGQAVPKQTAADPERSEASTRWRSQFPGISAEAAALIKPDRETGRPCVNGYYLDTVSDGVFERARFDQQRSTCSVEPIIRWLADDIRPEVVYEQVARVAARDSYSPPSSLAYFDPAVRERHRPRRAWE